MKPKVIADHENEPEEETKEESKDEKVADKTKESDKECLVDRFIGKYKTEKDLKIGDRDMAELIETCEKNNKKFQNIKKFE